MLPSCNMESVAIPRPPVLSMSPIVPSYPLKGPLLPPPPTPKPDGHETPSRSDNCCQVTRDLETGEKKVHQGQINFEERRITQMIVDKNTNNNESVRSRMSSRSMASHRSNGFRLIDNNNNGNHPNNSNNDDSGSIYSIYKQKIDSMFESDSNTSHTSNHNSVQAKIEQMFSDVAKDNGMPQNPIGVHAFSVDYLGSVALQDKVTSLAGLQMPLRDLYFSYKKITKSQKVLSGRLEISAQGLRVQYQAQAGDLEQMNSFPTIAVWSAVKFVIQESSSSVHGKNWSYAFLPLITDPDNMDKQTLFRNLEESERKYILKEEHSPLFAVVMRKIGVQRQLECHGFVCQTSEDAIVIAATLYKSLVNHMKHKEKRPRNKNGVTTCMSTASSTIIDKNGKSIPVRPPRRKRSSAGSSVCSDTTSIANVSDTQPLLPPSKPPKKSTKTKRAPRAPDDHRQQDINAILPYEEPIRIISNANNISNNNGENKDQEDGEKEVKPKTFSDKINTFMSKEQRLLTAEIKQVVSDTNKGLKRVQSLRRRNEEAIRKKDNSGDIFTKVTIPRSGSFLNTGGLTRYKNKSSRNNESASGGSPLGFKEIFHELSLQEGLHSMDDILSVIIDPDGMSFNDLKPIYKEFLLKLAVTLTKDELYLKSKSIMRRQRRKAIKKSMNGNRSPNKLVSGKFKRLKHIFQKSLRKKSSKKLLEENSRKSIDIRPMNGQSEAKLPESSISTSSYDTKQFRTKEEISSRKGNYRKKTHGDFSKNRRRERASTSEESDFFSLKRQNKFKAQNTNPIIGNQNRNSSSGYVSCSECSYDSDTCTCVSADKCYCSLGQRNFEPSRRNNIQEKCICTEDASLSFCECDTDSCAESNKCYCQYGSQRMKKQSKRSSQHQHHPGCAKNNLRTEQQRHKKLCKNNSNTKSTRSLEYMSNPSEGYYEKLRSKQKFGSERVHSHYSHHSLQRKRRNSHSGIGNNPPLLPEPDFSMVTLQNLQMGLTGGKLSAMDYELLKLAKRGSFGELKHLQESMFTGGFNEHVRDYWNGTRGMGVTDQGRQRVQSAITTGACTEALSVKKSAEMAAMFADIKLSQTTDITHIAAQGFDVDTRNMYNMEKSSQAKYSRPNKGPYASADIKAIPHHKPPHVPPNYARPSNLIKNKSKLYSSKNGLYTIQSQSDESRHSGSRRSSLNGEGRKMTGELEAYGSRRNTSSNIEDSLGYLP